MEPPAPNRIPKGLGRSWTDRRKKAHEELPAPILRAPRSKLVPQKLKGLVLPRTLPIVVLAVDDSRLGRVQLQSTFCEAPPQSIKKPARLPLRPAVRDDIIGEAGKRNLRMVPLHPSIELVVQEQIGQQRANATPP